MNEPTTPGVAELILKVAADAALHGHFKTGKSLAELQATIAQAEARFADLQAKLDAAGMDAARLDFLEDKDRCYWVDVQRQPDGMMMYVGQGPGLREAIDAAIAQRGEKGES